MNINLDNLKNSIDNSNLSFVKVDWIFINNFTTYLKVIQIMESCIPSSHMSSIFRKLPTDIIKYILPYDRRFIIKNGKSLYDGLQ